VAKTLFYRLFGLGKMPWELRSKLQLEGLTLFDEGIKASVTYLNFHRPGKYSNWQRQWFSACLALTNDRLLALRYGSPIINVPLADERLQRMQFSVEGSETLLVRFDAGLFHDDWSGTIEYRLRTDQAAAFLEALSRTNNK
jgi:hypothetical protein